MSLGRSCNCFSIWLWRYVVTQLTPENKSFSCEPVQVMCFVPVLFPANTAEQNRAQPGTWSAALCCSNVSQAKRALHRAKRNAARSQQLPLCFHLQKHSKHLTSLWQGWAFAYPQTNSMWKGIYSSGPGVLSAEGLIGCCSPSLVR